MSLDRVLRRWDLIESDFEVILHRDLGEVFETKTWRWFLHRLGVLIADKRSSLYELSADDAEPETPHG